MTGRLLVLVALVVLVAAGTLAYRRWERGLQHQPADKRVPAELLGPGDRTWVLFSTPTCATCGPAEQQLRDRDPDATVRRIDATERADLTQALGIRAAPTVLLAGPDGSILLRLAGPRAVMAHLAELAPA
jgi:hypothetical protein